MSDQLETDLLNAFKGAIHKASDSYWYTDMLGTGIIPIDYALGQGFGYGRISEVYGEWSSGKTMLLYYTLINNQKLKGKNGCEGKSILFESEGAFTPSFFSALGGDPDKLLVYSADTVEDVFDGIMKVCKLMRGYAKKGDDTPVVIGWDSIAATGTRHLQTVGMDKRDMSKAGAMSFGTQLITTEVKKCRVAIIATNQTREKIGSMDSSTHTPGGSAWPFHSSQRVELMFEGGSKGSIIWDKEEKHEIGRWVKGSVTKNKLASPFGKFSMPIYIKAGARHPVYETETKLGINSDEALFWAYYREQITLAKGVPVITGAAGWYTLNGSIAEGEVRFRQSQWLEILDKYPQLRTLPFEGR